jgi:phosphatidylinositol alpha-1,6-mannosyltransferase
MDTLIDAAAMLQTDIADLTVAIGGTGRDADRLERRVSKTGAPVKMLGRVSDDDLPGLVAAADVFVMACRSRWGGLEQEGFGIVFVEAAAAGVPQIAGRSGGADDAVIDGETGVLLDHPEDPRELRDALRSLLADEPRRRAMGDAGRSRAVASFDYDALAHRLGNAFAEGWPLG